MVSPLKKAANVFGRKNELRQEYLSIGDAPVVIGAPQDVVSTTNVRVLLRLAPAAIQNEVRVHDDLRVRVPVDYGDVGENVTGVGRRILRPGHAGFETRDALLQRLLRLIEDR